MDENHTLPRQAAAGSNADHAATGAPPPSSREDLIRSVAKLAFPVSRQHLYWGPEKAYPRIEATLQQFNDRLLLRLWRLLELTDAKHVVALCLSGEECDPRLLTLVLDHPEQGARIFAIIHERGTCDYGVVSTVFKVTPPLSGGAL